MLRWSLHTLHVQHAHCLLRLFQHINNSPSCQQASRTLAGVPEAWRKGYESTAPVPTDASGTTAFSWAKKQVPGVPLAVLGKLFRTRQVRLLQGDQVKRITRTRSLEPGDVLLLPKEPQSTAAAGPFTNSQSRLKVAAGDADGLHLMHNVDPIQQQQQQPSLRLMGLQQRELADVATLQQQQQQQQLLLLDEILSDNQDCVELSNSWIQNQLGALPDVLEQQQLQKQSKVSSRNAATQQQQQQDVLTVQKIRKWMLASSPDFAIFNKPPGVALHSSHSSKSPLDPIFSEALRLEPPHTAQLVCGLDVQESGAVVIARHAAAHEWLSAWVAGDPVAVAAAAAAVGTANQSSSGSSKRVRQQQKKLSRLTAAAAAVESVGSSSHGVPTYTAKEVAGLQQLMLAVGGLRLRRVFWAVVQGRLPVRQTGTLRNRMLRGDLSLPALTRYKVLASREGLSWLELQPLTNRQNQIRLHCAKTLGAPVLGDYKFGYRPCAASPSVEPHFSRYQAQTASHGAGSVLEAGAAADWTHLGPRSHVHGAAAERLMLHCREVVLLRPRKPPVRVIAPLPRPMRQLLHVMDWY